MNAKPTVREIAEASKGGHVRYEVISYQGVELLLTRDRLLNAVRITAEFTHDPEMEKLAETLGIKLRRFERES